jgi:hypothetical protein
MEIVLAPPAIAGDEPNDYNPTTVLALVVKLFSKAFNLRCRAHARAGV